MSCKDICPLANPDRHINEGGAWDRYLGIKTAYILYKSLKITVLQNSQNPHILDAKIPNEATVKCGLPNYIREALAWKSDGGGSHALNCPYVENSPYISVTKEKTEE